MIDREKTFEVFGYYPEDLKPQSHKLIIHNCDICGKERQVKKFNITRGHVFCISCPLRGENNTNYIDGRTINPICKYPGCNKRINKGTIGSGDGFCKKHSKLGERNGRYIDGRTPLFNLIRNSLHNKQWSLAVFKKDNFICQECGCKEEVSGHLTAHHKKHFSVILNEFLNFYSELSPIEDKEILVCMSESWPEFWDVNNGIALCETCHQLEHQKDRSFK